MRSSARLYCFELSDAATVAPDVVMQPEEPAYRRPTRAGSGTGVGGWYPGVPGGIGSSRGDGVSRTLRIAAGRCLPCIRPRQGPTGPESRRSCVRRQPRGPSPQPRQLPPPGPTPSPSRPARRMGTTGSPAALLGGGLVAAEDLDVPDVVGRRRGEVDFE